MRYFTQNAEEATLCKVAALAHSKANHTEWSQPGI